MTNLWVTRRFVTILDSLDARVEKLRKDALNLQEKKDYLLMSMDLIKSNEMMQNMSEGKWQWFLKLIWTLIVHSFTKMCIISKSEVMVSDDKLSKGLFIVDCELMLYHLLLQLNERRSFCTYNGWALAWPPWSCVCALFGTTLRRIPLAR